MDENNIPTHAYPGVTYTDIAAGKPSVQLAAVPKTQLCRCDFCGGPCSSYTSFCRAICYASALDDQVMLERE